MKRINNIIEHLPSLRTSVVQAVVIVLLIAMNFSVAGSSTMRVIFPTADKISTTTAHHYVIGEADTMKVLFIELSRGVDRFDTLQVRGERLNEDFVRSVKKLFEKNMLVTRFELTIFPRHLKDKPVTLSATYPVRERYDLKRFTQSQDFLKIYSRAIRDTSIASIAFHITGNQATLLEMNNVKRRAAMGSNFILRMDLQPGQNDYLLRALGFGMQVIEEKRYSVYYSFGDKSGPDGSDYQTLKFHASAQERECIACHRIEPLQEEKTSYEAVVRFCYPCHAWTTAGTSVHPPAADWNCFYCHTGENAAKNGFPVPEARNSANTCFECHSDKKDQVENAKVKHPPFESGDCKTCHSPHSSSQQSLLVTDVVTLCLTCHEPKYAKDHPVLKHPLGRVMDPLHPKKELTCVSCHDPHATANQKLFTKASGRYQLCQECHKK